jgi:hypothetical protein
MDVHVSLGVTHLEHGMAFYPRGLGFHLRRLLRPQRVELEWPLSQTGGTA